MDIDRMTVKDESQSNMGKIYMAMGYFLLFFSLIILLSIFFTETWIGKMTNLGAGVILLLISLAELLYGYRLKQKAES